MIGSSNYVAKLILRLGMVGISMTAAVICSYWYYIYAKKDKMPLKWRRVGTLNEIKMFPIKSAAPLQLVPKTEVQCDILGLHVKGIRDRCLMVVNEKNEMVTARIYPNMVLIKTQVLDVGKLLLTAPGKISGIELDINIISKAAPCRTVHTSVWGCELDAVLCGEKFDQWFSNYILGRDYGLRLVFYPHLNPVKAINKDMQKQPFISPQDTGTFNDATSYMLINLSSVTELNMRLPKPVKPLQFRSNFDLKMDDDTPFAEDSWNWIKIGDQAVFRNISPCARCILPNINSQTGERDPDGQPLKTLKGYRKTAGYKSPIFGINLGLRSSGSVKVNDVVYVEDN